MEDLKQEIKKTKTHFLFVKISDTIDGQTHNSFNVSSYPNLRFYSGSKTLYLQYQGTMTDKEGKLSEDVQKFFRRIFRDSYKKVTENTKNAEEYLEHLQTQPSFLYYVGNKTSKCFKVFRLFSQITDEYSFVHFTRSSFKKHINIIDTMNVTKTIDDGFYLKSNFSNEGQENITDICSGS